MAGMQLPQWLARFNRYFTNPIQRLWAGWLPGYGIIGHVGRKSGKRYRTPVGVFPTHEGLAILLTYGRDRDWVKNLTAANGCVVKHYGKTVAYINPRVMSKAEAVPSIKGYWQPLFARLPFQDALLLTRA